MPPSSTTKCQRVAGYAHDALTIAMSITDIVCDVLVAKEFYDAGAYDYFRGSIAIFALAQPVNILQNTFSDRTRCIAQLRARMLIPAECSAVS